MKLTAGLLYAGLLCLSASAVADDADLRMTPSAEVSVEITSPRTLDVTYTIPEPGPFEAGDRQTLTRWIAVAEGESVALTPRSKNADKVGIGQPIYISGIDLIPVTFTPRSIDPGSSMEVAFSVQLPPNPPSWEGVSPGLRRAWLPLLLNRDQPRRDHPGVHVADDYIYVVPTDERVLEAIDPLVEWRRLQGYNVIILNVPNWLPAGQRATFLRETIIDEHERRLPVEYVCLVGDTGGDFVVPTFSLGMSDYPYGLLAGDDVLPEAAVGRISYNSIEELERIVAKIMNYEKEPDLEDIAWYRQASVCAGNRLSGFSTILVSQWVRDLLLTNDYTAVDTFWYTMGNDIAGFMREAFDGGSAFVNYRGWTGLENWTVNNARNLNNRHLPVALLLGCNSGDYRGAGYGYTEALLRARGGAIGAIGTSGAQSRVNYNNALMAGFYRGVVEDGVHSLGWALVRAKLELFAAYSAVRMERVSDHVYWTNLMGDPGTILWRGVPREVTLSAPEEVEIGDGEFEVTVTDDEDEPVADARIGLLKVGEFVAAAYTDEDGRAIIPIDPTAVTEGEASVTVSGDRIIPMTVELELLPIGNMIAFRRYDIMDQDMDPFQGNGDGVSNPFEIVQLDVTVYNSGEQVINGPIVFTLEVLADYCTIQDDEYQHDGDLPPNDLATATYVVAILANFPDREDVPFAVTVAAGNDEWVLEFAIQGASVRWEVVENDLMEMPDPGDFLQFNLTLANNGQLDVSHTFSTLISLSEDAIVLEGEVQYDTLRAGETQQSINEYIVEIDMNADFGALIPFELELRSEENYEGVATFTIDLSPPPDTEPTGPDEYGYYAIDSRDAGSNLAPGYMWNNIDPEDDGSGENTGILDQGEDEDESILLQLPFTFRYYGRDYNLITVCSNGWAAFGDQSGYVDFRNLPIGSPQGPRAQLCPWWDDLYQPGRDGNVYYWYDEQDHRFLIQWDNMRRYVGPAGPGAYESFQIILLDPQWHPTVTGDGDVIFMYNDITHEARVDGHGTPYATVGIGTPDDRGGLQYGFWNRWAPGASQIGAQSAIRFTTSTQHIYGIIEGIVRSFPENDTIVGASINISPGGWGVSDSVGYYFVDNVIVDRELILTASAPGYNTVTQELDAINRLDIIEVNLQLPYPVIDHNLGEISDTLDEAGQVEHRFAISNSGSGSLEFSIDFAEPVQQEPDGLWERLLTIDVTAATGGENGDHRILGVIFNGDRFFVSGGNNGDPENYLYEFGRYGGLIRRIVQPAAGMWGMHDLAWDGERIYGGSGSWIYRWNLEDGAVDSIASPLTPARALAVDPDDGSIWIANIDQPIIHLDAEGQVLETYDHRLAPFGLAWHPNDPDGCPLYIFSNDGATHLALSKLDPSNGSILPVAQFEIEEGDRPGGCEFSLEYDPVRWSLVTVIQNPGGDRVEVLDAGINLAWLSVEPQEGTVEPEAEIQCVLTLSTADLRGGMYAADMIIEHNGAGEALRIPIQLFYDVEVAIVDEASPLNFALEQIYPNPTNGSGLIRFHLSRSGNVSITLWDANGRRITEIVNEHLSAGSHQRYLSAEALPSGIYYVGLKSTEGSLHRKFVLLK